MGPSPVAKDHRKINTRGGGGGQEDCKGTCRKSNFQLLDVCHGLLTDEHFLLFSQMSSQLTVSRAAHCAKDYTHGS